MPARQPGSDAKPAAKIAVMAVMDKAEYRVGRHRDAALEKAVQRFVDGAVAAHRDDIQMAVAQGVAHQLRGLGRARW